MESDVQLVQDPSQPVNANLNKGGSFQLIQLFFSYRSHYNPTELCPETILV